MFKGLIRSGACVAMVSNSLWIGAIVHASENDECVSVTAVGNGVNQKIVVSTTCNRPTKEVQIYCGVPGGYIESRVVRAWPGQNKEMPCDARATGTQWCYLIQPRVGERCL
jgi:hypothetical protein